MRDVLNMEFVWHGPIRRKIFFILKRLNMPSYIRVHWLNVLDFDVIHLPFMATEMAAECDRVNGSCKRIEKYNQFLCRCGASLARNNATAADSFKH